MTKSFFEEVTEHLEPPIDLTEFVFTLEGKGALLQGWMAGKADGLHRGGDIPTARRAFCKQAYERTQQEIALLGTSYPSASKIMLENGYEIGVRNLPNPLVALSKASVRPAVPIVQIKK